MSEHQARLHKATATVAVSVIASAEPEQARRREFGLACYGALIQLAAAFWRYFVGGEPPCLRK